MKRKYLQGLQFSQNCNILSAVDPFRATIVQVFAQIIKLRKFIAFIILEIYILQLTCR